MNILNLSLEEKVNFYKITGPLPTFDSKYEGLFVYTTNDKKLFLGVNGSWSELTNNEILDIIEQNERVTASALNDLNKRISNLSEVNASDVNNLNDKISNLSDIIEQDEEVTAASLNDLNERIDSMHVEIRNISRKLDELMNNSGV